MEPGRVLSSKGVASRVEIGCGLRIMDQTLPPSIPALTLCYQVRVGEIGVGHALLCYEGQIRLHLSVQIHRHIERGVGPLEFATHAAGEIDLAGHVVVRRSVCCRHGGQLSRFILVNRRPRCKSGAATYRRRI